MTRLRFGMFVLSLFGFAVVAKPADAQVFSPGELIRAHEELDSLKSCKKCHSDENGIDAGKCLACHTTLRDRIQKREGYHGAPERSAQCESCHPDHKGRDAPPTLWPSGKRESFRHEDTGWALEGAHGKLACEKCHDDRHISDPAVRKTLAKKAGAATFLGLSRACVSCHFDEHRGQLGTDCASCHDQAKWKPAPKFDHAKYWKLEGAHGKAACDGCHKVTADAKFAASAFPAPRAATFLNMTKVPHAACTDCHKDPHQNRFGADCTSCHNQNDWRDITQTDKLAFHDKTAYPLKGRHRMVECAACHPVNKQGQKLLRPIAHDTCASCHPGAHPDLPAKVGNDCANCHSVDGYLPVRYTAVEHEATRYPLRDAHRAVACPECHLKTMGEPLKTEKAAVAKFLAARVTAPWRLRDKHKRFDKCADCHTQVHRDQFAPRDCASCHDAKSWAPAPGFNHDKARYKLDGQHRQVACRQCHGDARDALGPFVRYRPVAFADCADCHRDAHYGQFRLLDPKMACSACHTADGFKKTKFSHEAPAFTDFPLKGAHAKVACARCHVKVNLTAAGAVAGVVRYRPTPDACELCHEDEHKGKYRDASRLLKDDGKTAAGKNDFAAGASSADPWSPPSAWFKPLRQNPTRCTACHEESGWRNVRFSHDVTGFRLRGAHAVAACGRCHTGDAKDAPPRDCAACHADPHRGSLGARCAECHNDDDFRQPTMSLARHAQTSFALEGVHAVTPCAECHRDAVGMGFRKTPRECVACHKTALPTASANVPSHAGFSTSCGQCHIPVDWRAASYLDHDRCFPIGPSGRHSGIACRTCHKGGIPAVTNTCADTGVSCIGCHGTEADEHRGVNGYEPRDRKCYECHPGGRK